MTNSPSSKSTKFILTVAALMGALALSACGGGGSDGSHGGGGGLSASSSEGGSGPEFAWELKYTKCLRGNGIEIGDPDPVHGVPAVQHDAAYESASKTCESRLGPPPSASATRDPSEEKAIQETTLQMVKCLQEHGVAAKDPGPNEALALPEGTSGSVLAECEPKKGK